MTAQTELSRARHHGFGLLLRKDATARAVVRVLQTHERAARVIVRDGLHRERELMRVEQAARARSSELHAGQGSSRTRFVERDVRPFTNHDFITRARVHQERDLIAHRTRGYEQRALFAQDLRRAALELDHRRIFAVYVVANLG